MSAPELERAQTRASNDSSPPKKQGWRRQTTDPASALLRRRPDRTVHPHRRFERRPLRDGTHHREVRLQRLPPDRHHRTDRVTERPDPFRSAVPPRLDRLGSTSVPAAGETTRVLFTDPSLGESERLAVFVDPVLAQPVGELAVYGSSGSLPLRTWISQLHRHLHLGEPGRLYSELAASWMWVVATRRCLPLVPSIPHRPERSTAHDRPSIHRTKPDPELARCRRHLDSSCIGLPLGDRPHVVDLRRRERQQSENRVELDDALSCENSRRRSPSGDRRARGSRHGPRRHRHADGHQRRTRRHRPRYRQVQRDHRPVEVSIPANAETAFTVAQTRQPWVYSNNTIAIDGATQKVTDELWFSDWPLAAKLSAWGIQLHMGLLFGLANQIALAALALALVSVVIRGYIMWWRRRPHSWLRLGSRPGSCPRRNPQPLPGRPRCSRRDHGVGRLVRSATRHQPSRIPADRPVHCGVQTPCHHLTLHELRRHT